MTLGDILAGLDEYKQRAARRVKEFATDPQLWASRLGDDQFGGSTARDVVADSGSVMPGMGGSLASAVSRIGEDAGTSLGALSGVQAAALPLMAIHPLADAPLIGLPARGITKAGIETGPHMPAREAAAQYMRDAGLAHMPPIDYVGVDPERATRIAQAFDAMKHAPNDPAVKASYDAMINETMGQYEAARRAGLKVDFIQGADPYKGNPMNAVRDVRNNNHLYVFPTEEGFGGSASAHVDISGNPLLQQMDEFISGKRATANDIFRAVHDYFGHAKEGVGFRAAGEENAWQQHRNMYSALARPAMTTETRGQNSWVNFGPHAAANRTANGVDTQYAPQKIGLLPDWVMNEGVAQPPLWLGDLKR